MGGHAGHDQADYDQTGHNPGNFYSWRVSDGFAIHLSLNVVTQLAAQISRGGSESPDACGILLGRSIDAPFRATVIEDFKLIPSVAASALPDGDDTLFEIACRMAEAGSADRSVIQPLAPNLRPQHRNRVAYDKTQYISPRPE